MGRPAPSSIAPAPALFALFALFGLVAVALVAPEARAFSLRPSHPRLLINEERLKLLPSLVAGPLKGDYAEVKRSADDAVRAGRPSAPACGSRSTSTDAPALPVSA